ncbi:exostosin family [Seminavis robusta]|uniref:Exostosin family n=1 Tax=Seminavis robusta TaxID=568900 RepID=A0A9N8EZ07_9STRA|nr:exostosin family [Seminavis robusta]|eukprot:Sro2989_g341760.1 exostosin family (407) ;mRNA; f:1322-2542
MSNVSSSSVIRMAASLRLETPWHHDEDSASSNETTDQQITVSFSTPAAEERFTAVDSSSLFQLPFYIYDNELDWSVNATFIHSGLNRVELLHQSAYLNFKHSDDYWLLQHAKQHPMRTLDTSKAKLFLVPTLLSAWKVGYKGGHNKNKFCAHKGICNMQLLHRAEQLLQESKWYQRSQGRDHIVVDSHWRKHWDKLSYSHLLNCNTISFEHRIPTIGKPKQYQTPRVHIPSFYIGRPCSHHTNKTKDFAMIATLKPNSKLFQDRSHICDWLHEGQKHQNYTVALCGRGNQCPALGEARFGFHARGDTWGSNRLIDTLLSGAIPLITSPQQIQILPDFVPWEEVTYQVDVASAAAFDASLQSILQKPEQELEEKLTNISKHLDIFNHKKGRQFDLYMHRFAQLLELY